VPSGVLFGLIVVAAVVSALLCKAFARRWPQATTDQLVLRSAAPLPALIATLTIVGLISIFMIECAPNDDVCDGPAMAGAGIIVIGTVGSAVAFVTGAAVAWIALFSIRRP
jgi:hypothetical protein